MATITSKDLVEELIENDGYYPDDPRIYAIVEYINISRETVYGITWPHEPNKRRYMESDPPYVNHPKVLWCQNKDLITRSS